MDITLSLMPSEARLAVQDSQNRISADYARLMNAHPVLDADDEKRLAIDLHENNSNLNAAHTLVLSNLRGVVYVARNYMGYGLALMDLVQEGTIGLMKAVKEYNPYQKVRLFAWALPWIKSEIQQYVVRNWKMVKAATTDARKKLFFNLRKLKNNALPLGDNIRNIAQTLNIDEKDVRAMDMYMTGHDVDMEAIMTMPGLERPDDALEAKQRESAMTLAVETLQSLPNRESKIIHARYMQEPNSTLQELASEMGISVERVRQLEKQGLHRLQKLLHTEASVLKLARQLPKPKYGLV
jgi:RNA polymerase sigma-32 factor